MRSIVLLVFSSMLFASTVAAADRTAGPSKRQAAPAWIALFDGRSTAGWAMNGPGRFRVQGGALVTSGGMGILSYKRRRFRGRIPNFRSTGGSPSGATTRASSFEFPGFHARRWTQSTPDTRSRLTTAIPAGLAYQTGSIYDHAPATRLASRPAGQWNRFHIRVVGQQYIVLLNGVRVSKLNGVRARVGYVGLQNHDPGSRVSFRRIRARPLG